MSSTNTAIEVVGLRKAFGDQEVIAGVAAVVELVRIRTLAEAGVPVARVRELLAADPDEFAAAVEEIDLRLRAEIRERQRHRRRIVQLAAGDSLALPPEAVAYLDRMRELGFPEKMIEGERDAWILVAAQLPESMPGYMASKLAQLEDPTLRELYRALATAALEWDRDEPRLPALADRLVASIEAVDEAEWEAYAVDGGRRLDGLHRRSADPRGVRAGAHRGRPGRRRDPRDAPCPRARHLGHRPGAQAAMTRVGG